MSKKDKAEEPEVKELEPVEVAAEPEPPKVKTQAGIALLEVAYALRHVGALNDKAAERAIKQAADRLAQRAAEIG